MDIVKYTKDLKDNEMRLLILHWEIMHVLKSLGRHVEVTKTVSNIEVLCSITFPPLQI
jgi:hypothetical protein